MIKSCHLVITKPEQKNENQWDLVNSFVKNWNKIHEATFFSFENVLWKIILADIQTKEYDDLIREVNKLQEEWGIKYHLVIQREYNESDYNTADFVQILGITLDEQKDIFVLNEDEAFLPEVPCVKCGYIDSFSKIQIQPLVINEDLLKDPINGFTKPETEDWDFINVYGGRLLVSNRVIKLLKGSNAKGFIFDKVLKKDKTTFSDRIFQLEAEKNIFIPYFQAKQLQETFFCDVCGASVKATDQEFNIHESWVENLDFFSRHPNKSSLIYVSKKIFNVLRNHDVNGMIPCGIVGKTG